MKPRNMRLFFKRVLLYSAVVCVLPLIAISWIALLINDDCSERVFTACGEILAICPTLIGSYFRKAYYWARCTNVSRDAQFLFGSMLAHRQVTIGKGTVIGPYSFIGFAEIGENVLLASRISIVSGKYQHRRPTTRNYRSEAAAADVPNRIGDNCWIGANAVILGHVGSNCIIGAGSVVFNDVPDNCTVLGNPARKVNILSRREIFMLPPCDVCPFPRESICILSQSCSSGNK
jgi:virginiamycin A acetyltransferase